MLLAVSDVFGIAQRWQFIDNSFNFYIAYEVEITDKVFTIFAVKFKYNFMPFC